MSASPQLRMEEHVAVVEEVDLVFRMREEQYEFFMSRFVVIEIESVVVFSNTCCANIHCSEIWHESS